VLLVVAAGLAVGGSFAAFQVYRYESGYSEASTTTSSGWGVTVEPAPEQPTPQVGPLHGIPLTVAAVLALVAALLLVLWARRADDPATARLLGVLAGGVLIGVVSVIWLNLLTALRNVNAVAEEAGPDSSFRATAEVGAGAYLVLVAGAAALVAVALLLVPRRPDPGGHPASGLFPPLGPGPQPPWWPAPQPWPQPGPGGPQPGWGPPPPAPPPHHR
jgi:hypothetical protein